jgi:hypothetical protein
MLLTSNWRNLASSSLRVGGYLRLTRWHLLVPPLMARRQALPRPPRYQFHDRHLDPWRRGRGIPPIIIGPPPSLSSSSSDDEFADASGGESPYCLRSRYSSLYYSRRSRRLSLFSFARAARSCSRHCVARPVARARGVGGSDRAAFTVTICGQESSRPTRI